MKIVKVIKFVGVVTFLALCYIHLQVKIIDYAYQGKKKERHMRELAEQNGHLTYAITMLKSARNLGSKMLNENSKMQFASPDQIVRIPSERTEEKTMVSSAEHLKNWAGSLLSFLPDLNQ